MNQSGNVYVLPEAPKRFINFSTKADALKALPSALAMKNKVPIEPPNSGPKALLIMSEIFNRAIILLFISTRLEAVNKIIYSRRHRLE